jgi:hypothetical protein
MTTPPPTRKRQCQREGCKKPVHNSTFTECCFICSALVRELAKAQRACEAAGPSATSTELWAAAVEVSDAWTRLQLLHSRLFREATASGIDPDVWSAIKRGEYTHNEETPAEAGA